jgi:hypothetical protein
LQRRAKGKLVGVRIIGVVNLTGDNPPAVSLRIAETKEFAIMQPGSPIYPVVLSHDLRSVAPNSVSSFILRPNKECFRVGVIAGSPEIFR